MKVSHIELPLKLDVRRLTALWGFSEAALGTILHILKVPLTGLLIGGAAVFFIALIYRNAKSPSQILKSTLIVVLIKAAVTPFVPLNSFLAVSIQGFLGYVFFRFIPSYKLAAVVLSIITLTVSALQKLIIITLVFGNAFWESIDSFATYIITQHPFLKEIYSIKLSLIIISIYTVIHFLGGMFIGIKAANVDRWLEKKRKSFNLDELSNVSINPIFYEKKSRKNRSWWKKKSGILLLIFSVSLMILSYTIPQLGKSKSLDIFIMIIRSILVSLIWFKVISPIIIWHFQKFVEKRKFEHAAEINRITSLFPQFKTVINYCWDESYEYFGMRRILVFLSNSLALLLIIKLPNE